MPPIHGRNRWWGGMLEGAVAGVLPKCPWTGGGTKVRTPDDNNCQSMAHTTRPSMSLMQKSCET